MAETVTNLKVRFGADTKGFKQELDSGKAAVDNFSGSAKSSFSKFAAIFGVDLDRVSAGINSAKQSLGLLSGGFKGAAESSNVFSAAMKIVKLALVSTGVGALVVAFGALVSFFTQTERGAEAIERVMASIKAVFNVLTDTASNLGETIVNAFKNPKETINDLWEFIKSQFINRITAIPRVIEAAWNIVKGIFSGGVGEAAKEMASAMLQMTTGLDKVQQSNIAKKIGELGNAMSDAAKKGYELEKASQALEDRERSLIETQAERKRKIEELRLAAKDLTLSEEERLKKINEAMAIEKAYSADQISLQREKVRIAEEQFNMAEKRDEAETNLRNERAKLSQLEADSLKTIRGMSKEYNSLTNEINANAEAARKARNEKDAGTEDGKSMNAMDQYKPPKDFTWKLIGDPGNEKWTKVLNEGLETDKLEASAEKAKSILGNLQTATISAGAAIEAAMIDLAVSFGENIGLLIAGADGAKGINEILGSVLGDMLVTIGKSAIAAGTGFLAIGQMFKASIGTPGAAIAAIAAGIAMVAIGTAWKSSVSSVANGGGGSFSGASSGGGSSSGSLQTAGLSSLRSAPMTINIVGSLRAQGAELVAVIDKANQRKGITT